MAQGDDFLAGNYRRYPIVLERGAGVHVWDSDGKEYIDFVSGIAVCNVGHCHPKVVAAIQEQAQRLLHVSNLYYIEPQVRLARWLAEHSFAEQSFFCNSGAEAIEAALKLARRWAATQHGPQRFEIICMQDSFHGRTFGALSATGQPAYHEGFEPLVPGFVSVPYNDLTAMEEALNERTCAVLLEPIQGEGGVNVPDSDYLSAVRALCDEHQLLLIFDEIQTGIGRTGKLFAYEHFGVEPDIMALAKGIAGGVPMGAIVARADIMSALTPGTHASTFGGNPLASAAALATVTAIEEEGLVERCERIGAYFARELERLGEFYPLLGKVRGKGLLLGLELPVNGAPLVEECMKRGFLINCIKGNILRFVPPLTIEKSEIDALLACLRAIFDETDGLR